MPLEWLIDIIKEWVIAQAYATEAWVEAKGYATMQWVDIRIASLRNDILIAIAALKTWVQDQNYLTTGFIDRGDPAVADWTEANFTEDSAWHDLDLSAIVPAGAKVVLFSLWLRNTLINKDAQLRKKGNSNEVNMSIIRTQVGGVYIFNDLSCPCDSDRKIQYRFTVGGVYTTRLIVKGWWL